MKFKASLLFGFLLYFNLSFGAQDFFLNEMENVLDNLTGNNATTSQDWGRTVDVQGKRYYIGGNLQYPIDNEVIQPVQVTPPRISAGCGGISVSLGSLSYLKFDQLVDKLENALRQAPALAVQLVISNLCEKCAAVLSFLEQVSDIINGLNMDSCSLAKAGVGLFAKKTGLLTDINSGTSAYEDAHKWLEGVQNAADSVLPGAVKEVGKSIVNAYQSGLNSYDCAVITDPQKRSQCFADMVGTLGDIKDGILHTALLLSDSNNSDFLQDVENILRAYIGDFVVNSADGSGKFKYISPKYDAGDSFAFLLYGEDHNPQMLLHRVDKDGADLSAVNIQTLIDNKANELNTIYNKVLSGASLTDSERRLISAIPVPIYAYFRDIARLNYIDNVAADEISDQLIKKVSRYLVSHTLYSTLIKGSSFIANNTGKISATVASGDGSGNEKVAELVNDMEIRSRNIVEDLKQSQANLKVEFNKEMKEFKDVVQQARNKVLRHLASYQYSSSYNYANRN